MAFIDIEDPIRREEIVQDYIKNIKEIRARKEDEFQVSSFKYIY